LKRDETHAPGAHSRSEQGVDCESKDCINSQRQHKIFEILRIRNRFDPALLDVVRADGVTSAHDSAQELLHLMRQAVQDSNEWRKA
jgi:hypothetical protein